MASQKDSFDVEQPYKGELLGMGATAHFAAHGPGAHVVCQSKKQAEEVAAALNAAFISGILYQLRRQ